MDIIAMYFGYGCMAFLLAAILFFGTTLEKSLHIWAASFFGFGIIICRSESAKKRGNKVRKTEGKTVFITAPYWFNRYVWNIGGAK